MTITHRAKILATIGPSSNSEEIIRKLVKAGANGFRLNTSHGSLDQHKKVFDIIRSINHEIPILVDLPGVKIRTARLENPIEISNSELICLYPSDKPSPDYSGKSIPIDYESLAGDVKSGDSIFINDGVIQLKASEIKNDLVYATVEAGGLVESRKGVNLPDSALRAGVPTKEDSERIKFACDVDADYIALSFVSYSDEIAKTRELIESNSNHIIPIIAKIETKKGLENFSEILHESNAIMVARGDMGVEIPPERVPVEQRRLIYETNRAGKLCIVATQMLESMTRNPIATRAEISDVFTAVDQGADTVMLSGETASGQFPVKAVEVMHKVVTIADEEMSKRREPADYDSGYGGYVRIQELLGHAVKTMSQKARYDGEPVKAIVIPTRYGSTAKVIAKYRPQTPIIASSPEIHVIRELNLTWGLHTLYITSAGSNEENFYRGGLASDLFKGTLRRCIAEELLFPEDLIMVVSSSSLAPNSPTNLVGVFTVKDIPMSNSL